MDIETRDDLETMAIAYVKENALDADEWSVVKEFHSFEVENKAEEDERDGIKIKGYLSTFKNTDRQGDIVNEAAFDKSIKGLKKLPMLKDHRNETDSQIGSWTKLSVNQRGLFVEGFISKTAQTEHLITLIQDGHLDTLSMGGMFKYAQDSGRKEGSVIDEVVLLEGSVVSIPANPKAQFTMKSLGKPSQVESNGEGVLDDRQKSIDVVKELYRREIM